MYTIISGTDRKGSNTLKIALHYQGLFKEKGIFVNFLSLEGLDLSSGTEQLKKIEEEIIKPTTHFIFVCPEYNGSFPGVLKLMIDRSSSNKIWWNKKAMITGVSTGRAGNLRGMDHLAGILNYLRITVYPNMLPISVVDKLLDENDLIKDEITQQVIRQQWEGFLEW